MKNAHTMFERARHVYADLVACKYTTIAGTLVFFLITSIVPFLFWLTLLFGQTGTVGEELFELELFGWAKDLLLFLRANAEGASRGAGLFFLGTTLWSSSGFFYHLRRSGEIVYEYNRHKHGWKVRLSAIALTFAVLLFFALAGGVLFAGIFILRRLSRWIFYPLIYSLLLVLGFFAAWILNGYVCPYRVSPADTALGSFVTAMLWLLASAAFSIYLRFASAEKLYGALSLVIVFLLWLYWMMICFTAGMIFVRRGLRLRGREHKRL